MSLMKKIFYSIFALCAITVISVSCEKESGSVNKEAPKTIINPNIPTEIYAVINPDDAQTKAQYESNVTFGWTYGDQVRMPVVKRTAGTITACDYYTFTTTADSGSSSAAFTINGGSADMETYDPNPGLADGTWTSLGYLVYPNALVASKEHSGDYPVVNLPASIAYNSSAPLDGGVVPLIGRKDGETYKFSTAVGIIKLTVTNAPAEGMKIKLVSTDSPIAGKFAISDVDSKVSQIENTSATAGTYELSLTGLSLTAGETYSFYFPVPVGTYSANSLTFSVLDNNDIPLLRQTVAKSLTITRNAVLSIPAMLYHRVYVKGSLSNPKLYTVNPYSSTGTIRMIVSRNKLTKANYTQGEWPSGNKFSANQNGWAMNSHADFLKNETGTGLFYLQYIVCTDGTQPSSLSDGNVAAYGSAPFYFAPAGNKIPVESTWLDVPCVSTAEGAVEYLVDGNTGTYWHSPYGSESPARNATYGQIISVDLNEGTLTTDGNFIFSFLTRSGAINNHAKSLNVYVSNVPWSDAGFDAGKVLVGSTTNALEGIYPYNGEWIKTPIVCSGTGTYRYITVSILSCLKSGVEYDLRTTECTHMAEIEFYTK